MSLALLAVGVGGLAFAAALLVLSPRRSWVQARLEPHVGSLDAGEAEARPRLGRLRAGSQRFDESTLARALRRELRRAGSGRSPSDLAWVIVAAGLAGWAAGAFLSLGGAAVVLLAVAALPVPLVVLRVSALRRRRAFDDQLPDLLEMIGAALRVGHGFEQALRSVAESAEEPAASELLHTLGEIRLGRPHAEALGDLGDRLGSADMPFVTTAVEIQHQVGGSLADLLAVVAETVRERQQFRRKLKALTGMGRASAVVLVLLPLFVAALLTLLSPSYMSPLWHTGTGRLLAGATLVLMVVGAETLRRIISLRS